MSLTQKTPLYIEDLLAILSAPRCMTVAGYDGTCERVIRYDVLVSELKALLEPNHEF